MSVGERADKHSLAPIVDWVAAGSIRGGGQARPWRPACPHGTRGGCHPRMASVRRTHLGADGAGPCAPNDDERCKRFHGLPVPEEGCSDGCTSWQPPRSVFRPYRRTAPIATVAGAGAPHTRAGRTGRCCSGKPDRLVRSVGRVCGRQHCARQFDAIVARSARKISTRRFWARPSAVALVAIGSRSPRPSMMIRLGLTPRAAR